ncbi:UDP-N-acetylglucosamine 4,6-dehydratase [Agarivorans sp. Toyoura001]|nr:UDP-N-acetylglucosamine 4,6-dehydratase [Agarivorans sp. Toyoura001]
MTYLKKEMQKLTNGIQINMNAILPLIGRTDALFTQDIGQHEAELSRIVSDSRFLVLGGAGSIGQAVTKEIFKRNPKKLHVVDISENNMVEVVRDIRSSFGYIDGDFQTFALDIGSIEYDAFIKADGQYDYVLNLSALKHVRSEKDPYTLMRMIDVNVFNTDKTIQQSIDSGVKKYFCVSTDKAANPVNMMGASKRIMEMFLMRKSEDIAISTARFANVAFSDGSLLHGFNQRLLKNQPIVAPNDIKRYFVTPQESGELCLMSCIFGENRDIFFPKLSEALHLISFADIAVKYLEQRGYEPHLCESEDEARELAKTLPAQGKWPCLFTSSDTTGEKDFEEFFTDKEALDMARFANLGIIKNDPLYQQELLSLFEDTIGQMKSDRAWTKEQIVELFFTMIPDFGHKETGKYLDSKM